MRKKPASVDEYLAALSSEKRQALERIRTAIQAAVPSAVECISHGMPAFKLDGKPLIAFGAAANHCLLHPMSSITLETLEDELKEYDLSGGTIRFPPGELLPSKLVRKVVQARLAEHRGEPAPISKSREPHPTERSTESLDQRVAAVVAELRRRGSKATREGMSRYAIPSEKAFGVAVGVLQKTARRLGRDHELAMGLWETGWYEARMLACFIDEPASVTPTQMDRWCRDFDSWAICDTACFHLFDRTPFAFTKVEQWAPKKEEFVRRGAFALLWGLTVHSKISDDGPFVRGLELIEKTATDDRNFVKKAVNMALRAIGKRSLPLNEAAAEVAARLADSADASARWIGKHALREITSPAVLRQIARRAAPGTK